MSAQLCFAHHAPLTSQSFLARPSLVSHHQRRLPIAAPASHPRPNKHAVKMAFSSIEGVLTPSPMSLPDDLALIVRAVYTQVLGNAHLMDSERAELASAESHFVISRDVREFVRAVALSEQYKHRFLYSVSQYRFVELAFKHFLGRAPESAAEYARAMACYNENGYDAFVSLFVDSEEYDENFGSTYVPYGIYKGCYSSNQLFNRSVALRLAPAQSDKGRPALLQYSVLSGDSPSWLSISKALPTGTEKGTGFTVGSYWQFSKRNENATVRVATPVPGGVVFF